MYNPNWPLTVHVAVFAVSGLLVAVVGTQLAKFAENLARRTGLGQAMTGALFLGASTSLSGIIASVTAASNGHAELAASNAVGGIAAQTVFLAIADMFYRKANLEHAAASDENMLQGALLIALLGLVIATRIAPAVDIWGVHPSTVLLLAAYVLGQRLIYAAQKEAMWRPRRTEHTQDEAKENEEKERETGGREESLAALWLKFLAAAAAIGFSGYVLAKSGISIAQSTGLNETVVGGLFTAVSTSFPELITAVAAVRRGALTLAVSDIIGGNAFDTIFLAVSDVAYREGSLYHAMGQRPGFLAAMTVVLTSVLLLGLLRRERHGIANIGFESFLVLLVYGAGFTVLVTTMGQ